VRLGAWMPFGRAAGELAWLTRVSVSEATACRLAEAAGAAYAAVQTAEAERVEREVTAPAPGPALQLVSADGAMVPLVGGVWGEVRTLAIGTVEAAPTADDPGAVRAIDLSYFSRLADAATFTRLALVETQRRGIDAAGVVVGVMDGAEWEQAFLDRHRPDAVRVLDFPHGVEHLSAAAQATFGAGTAEAIAWLAAQAHGLKHADPAAVLDELRRLPTARARDPAAAGAARDATLGYLEKRRAQIRYAEFRARGYPIGSGAVESANKLLVEVRLKGSGMHWAPRHVNPMLALRTIVCNDRWDEAWPQLCRQLRAQERQRARERRRARYPAPAPPPPAPTPPKPAPQPERPPRLKTIVDGRPTTTHPWNRRFLPERRRAS
jgi:hypothetical protein